MMECKRIVAISLSFTFLMLLLNAKASPPDSGEPKVSKQPVEAHQSEMPHPLTAEQQWLMSEYLWRKKLETLTVPKALNMATEIRVYRRSNDLRWQATPLIILSEKSNPYMFHLLQKTKQHIGPIAEPLDFYKMDLVVDDNILGSLTYFPNGGHIGDGEEWGNVPSEFIAWTTKMAKANEPIKMPEANKPN